MAPVGRSGDPDLNEVLGSGRRERLGRHLRVARPKSPHWSTREPRRRRRHPGREPAPMVGALRVEDPPDDMPSRLPPRAAAPPWTTAAALAGYPPETRSTRERAPPSPPSVTRASRGRVLQLRRRGERVGGARRQLGLAPGAARVEAAREGRGGTHRIYNNYINHIHLAKHNVLYY